MQTKYNEKESSIYASDNLKKTTYRNYDEVSIIDVVTGKKEKMKADIRIRSCQEKGSRIIIHLSKNMIGMFDTDTGERGFYVFDEDGKLILGKQGEYSYRCGENRYTELMYTGVEDVNKRIGLYDEITGAELVPMRYSYICVWRNKDGNILAVGVPDIMDYEKGIEYFEYDFRRESQIGYEQSSYPTGAECADDYSTNGRRGISLLVLEDRLKALGYEEIELLAY